MLILNNLTVIKKPVFLDVMIARSTTKEEERTRNFIQYHVYAWVNEEHTADWYSHIFSDVFD